MPKYRDGQRRKGDRGEPKPMQLNSQQKLKNEMRIFVDPHVHIHACFPLHKFFDSACVNFAAQAYEQDITEFGGVLLLTESQRDDWFFWLAKMADEGEPIRNGYLEAWTVCRTEEKSSLILQSHRGDELVLVAGRQIITKEKLEVLALLTETVFPDGASLATTVEAIRNSGGLPMVPWGVSTWSGERGKILSEFLPSQMSEEFFLGDISGRPKFLPCPEQFIQAEAQGVKILPGSDPLPLRSEYWRAGSAGFSIAAEFSEGTPAQDLKHWMQDPTVRLIPYHSPETLFRFTKNFLARRKIEKVSRSQRSARRPRQHQPVRARS